MKVKIGNYPKKTGDRKVKVEISSHDLYNLDTTLALVIAPALKMFKQHKGGIPGQFITNRYYELSNKSKLTSAEKRQLAKEEKLSEKNYNDVLDSMIWSFEQLAAENDMITGTEEERKAHDERIQLGLDNFAKHYSTLWN